MSKPKRWVGQPLPEGINDNGLVNVIRADVVLAADYDALLARCEKMKAALEFYAQGKHLEEQDHEVIEVMPGNPEYVDHLVGVRARKVLAEIEEKSNGQ